MYLHIGEDYVVKQEEIVGIFDIEHTTISSVTREFLKEKEKNKKTFVVNNDMPKAFIVLKKGNECHIYFTSISSITLRKRMEENLLYYKFESGGNNDY